MENEISHLGLEGKTGQNLLTLPSNNVSSDFSNEGHGN